MTRIGKKKFGLRIHHNFFFRISEKNHFPRNPRNIHNFFFTYNFFKERKRRRKNCRDKLCVKAVEKIGRVAFFNFQSVVILSPE